MSKKAAAKPKDEVTYELRDIVLAKIRGFPAWPAMVVDPEDVPKEVAKERPQGKKQAFYCVRFFPAGDYSWVLSKDLSKLKKHEIEAYIAEPHKKSGELMNGYRIALNPETWEKEREAARLKAEEEQAEEEVDELEGEEEPEDDDDEKPAKTKKRKRDSEAGTKAKPRQKKEKVDGETAPKKKKSVEKADKPPRASKKNGVKSKALVESEDEGERAENAGPSKKATPPPTKKARRDKEEEGEGDEFDNDPEATRVKEWRHKLQRVFLGKTLPKDEDMPQYDAVFSQVEVFDMTVKYLQFSKIGKVMRHIAALADEKVPRDSEFKFKDRAQALVNKWHTTLDKEKEKQHHGSTNGNAEAERQHTEPERTVAEDRINTNGVMKVDEGAGLGGDISMAVDSTMGDVTMSEAA